MTATYEPTAKRPGSLTMWPILVINLDGATDRMTAMAAHLGARGLVYERMSAVDGAALSPDLRDTVTATGPGRRFKRMLTPPEIGCYLSHLLAWNRIARGDSPGAFVLEDDARLVDGAERDLAWISAQEPDWDVLKICHNGSARRHAGERGTAVLPRRMPPCTTGYAITRAAAPELLRRLVPFTRPIDNDLKYWWEHGACVKITSEPLGFATDAHSSTSAIAAARAGARVRGSLRRALAHATVELRRQRDMQRYRASRPVHRQWPDMGPCAPALPAVLVDRLGSRE